MIRITTAHLAGPILSCLLLLLAGRQNLHAQAAYTATRSLRIQAGAGVMILNNDYLSAYNKGLTFFADVDFHHFIGLEADVHLGGLIAPDQVGENSYLAGPRFSYRRRNANVYGKILIGRASITNQAANLTTGFNAYAYGGGLEYRATQKLNLRLFDVELQKWPDFVSHTLSPIAITVGVAYILR